jgi:hypothetical protein
MHPTFHFLCGAQGATAYLCSKNSNAQDDSADSFARAYNNWVANAGGASVVLSLSFAPQQGVAHIIPMTRRDFWMLCILTSQKALHENVQPYRFRGTTRLPVSQ